MANDDLSPKPDTTHKNADEHPSIRIEDSPPHPKEAEPRPPRREVCRGLPPRHSALPRASARTCPRWRPPDESLYLPPRQISFARNRARQLSSISPNNRRVVFHFWQLVDLLTSSAQFLLLCPKPNAAPRGCVRAEGPTCSQDRRPY
jgi:hypothetical protein